MLEPSAPGESLSHARGCYGGAAGERIGSRAETSPVLDRSSVCELQPRRRIGDTSTSIGLQRGHSDWFSRGSSCSGSTSLGARDTFPERLRLTTRAVTSWLHEAHTPGPRGATRVHDGYQATARARAPRPRLRRLGKLRTGRAARIFTFSNDRTPPGCVCRVIRSRSAKPSRRAAR